MTDNLVKITMVGFKSKENGFIMVLKYSPSQMSDIAMDMGYHMQDENLEYLGHTSVDLDPTKLEEEFERINSDKESIQWKKRKRL